MPGFFYLNYDFYLGVTYEVEMLNSKSHFAFHFIGRAAPGSASLRPPRPGEGP